MYEPPLLNFYEDAIQRNGDPRFLAVSLSPTAAGAPAFPGDLSSLPPGFARPVQSIVAIDSDFKTQWSVLTNIQLERALTDDLSFAIGYVNSLGRNLPVLIDTNLVPTGPTLGDGRPLYSGTVSRGHPRRSRPSTTSTRSAPSAAPTTTRSPPRSTSA